MKTKFIMTTFIFLTSIAIAIGQTITDQKAIAQPAEGNSPVYFIISYDIVNMEEFQKYPPRVLPLLKKYGAEVLASDVQATVFEGTSKTMNAIIKFPSSDTANKCYNDPEYEPIKKIRINSTKNCTMVLVKQLPQP
ncbi:MAG: DUF1330 domain-containing protein [Bacteroidetes bacterium]|nr:DUF1330 domain-containing protein [Bacteroidota bacterium]